MNIATGELVCNFTFRFSDSVDNKWLKTHQARLCRRALSLSLSLPNTLDTVAEDICARTFIRCKLRDERDVEEGKGWWKSQERREEIKLLFFFLPSLSLLLLSQRETVIVGPFFSLSLSLPPKEQQQHAGARTKAGERCGNNKVSPFLFRGFWSPFDSATTSSKRRFLSTRSYTAVNTVAKKTTTPFLLFVVLSWWPNI